jgi:hypothetical protein
MTKHYEEKYTKPDLRRQIKDDLMQSDKGGKSGQWSARKSQLLVQEYEKQGGGYKQSEDDKDEAAQSLEEWSEQDWQTQAGEAQARQDGKTKRYLPKAVWDKLSDAEKQEAERTKQQASKQGEQYVEWPDAVKRAMQELEADGASESDSEPTKAELYEKAQDLEVEGRSQMDKDELQQAIHQAEAEQLDELTRDQLYEKAQALEIEGRSQMNKDELKQAIQSAR